MDSENSVNQAAQTGDRQGSGEAPSADSITPNSNSNSAHQGTDRIEHSVQRIESDNGGRPMRAEIKERDPSVDYVQADEEANFMGRNRDQNATQALPEHPTISRKKNNATSMLGGEPGKGSRTALKFSVRPYDVQVFKNIQGNGESWRRSRPGTTSWRRPITQNAAPAMRAASEKPVIKAAPPISLPPLRTRRGVQGISNKTNSVRSGYEERMKAFGLTRAGTEALDRRVIVLPSGCGLVAEPRNKGDNADTNALPVPPPVSPQIAPKYTLYPHSINEVLSTEPRKFEPRPNPPAFLCSYQPEHSPLIRATRFGSNTEWKHDTSVTVQPPKESHFFQEERERLTRRPHEGFSNGRKTGVRRIPQRVEMGVF